MVKKPSVYLSLLLLALTVASSSAQQLSLGLGSAGGTAYSISPPVDPGPRGGLPAAGGALAGLTPSELAFFNAAAARFTRPWSVSGTITNRPAAGLGPRYNVWNGCGDCHAYPAIGGSSPVTNPEVQSAIDQGASNTVPSFVHLNGPVVIPFQKSTGKLFQLYTIQGRTDAPGCVLAQPDFASMAAANDISPHMSMALFGDGLVWGTPDVNFMTAGNQAAANYSGLGINFNRYNRKADGTIATIGWKSESSSGSAFAAFAFQVDLGVTTRQFPTEMADDHPNCMFNALPEDHEWVPGVFTTPSASSNTADDVTNVSEFIRMLAPPTPASCSPTPCTVWTSGTVGAITQASVTHGSAVFASVGCAGCHIRQQTTGTWRNIDGGENNGISNTHYFPYSDYSLHCMGSGLDDGLTQGAAGHCDFKTPPLWGIGQKLFFLHDGRTQDLYQAIIAHASTNSEANAVIDSFFALSEPDAQDLLNFLRSL
jgi:CxxC motif-containing protein (DUF1111 family)